MSVRERDVKLPVGCPFEGGEAWQDFHVLV